MNRLIYFILFSMFTILTLPLYVITSFSTVFQLLILDAVLHIELNNDPWSWYIETLVEPVDAYLMNKFYFR